VDLETAKLALDIEMGPNDADAATVRDYLKELLLTVLIEEESFSGKRPFGNSGWQYELLGPIESAGIDCNDSEALFADLVNALAA